METTIFVLAGRRLKVPRVVKRIFQVTVSVWLTLLVILVIQVGDGLLAGRASSLQAATATWVAFIRRADILTVMTLTAVVTVLFVYWQRNHERQE